MNDTTKEKYLLAQYRGLREEIVSRTNAILQFAQFTLLAFGAILTVAYGSGGRSDLTLLYPFIALFVAIPYLANKAAIYSIGKFIRENIEPKQEPNDENCWWETWVDTHLKWYKRFRRLTALVLLVGTQTLALIAYRFFIQPVSHNQLPPVVLYLSAGSTLLTVLLLLIFDDWIDWKQIVRRICQISDENKAK